MSDHVQPSSILGTGSDGAIDWPRVSSAAKNLEAISRAIDQHNESCPYPAAEVRMNPFELERLGWEEIRGLPIVADPEIGTGRFRVVCSRDGGGEGIEEAEALGIPVEVAVPDARPSPQ
jgi:hypothetical protein